MPGRPLRQPPAPLLDVQALFREYVRLDRKQRQDALSPRELERWSELKRRLNATFSPPERPEHEEQRGSVRVPVRLRVAFESEGELKRCLLTNLSRGGVFVNTAAPPPIGTQLVLRIALAYEGREVEVPGEVVSHGVGRSFDTHRPGMGVKFLDPSPEALTLLDRLYEGALDRHPK